MANFGKIALTNTGINALVKAQAGNVITFTKIKMGSGMFSGDITTLSDLVETKLSANIVKGTLLDNTYTVEAHFTNEGLEEGFYWREIGLYVKDSNGNDTLFGYANAGTTADYIPATSNEIYSKYVRIAVAVGDSANITVEQATGTWVDVVTFESALEKKVDKVTGKGLSTNDYTDEDKAKVKGLGNYSLPIATSERLGGIKSSDEVKVNEDGTVSLPKHITSQEVENLTNSLREEVEDVNNALVDLANENESDFNSIKAKIGTKDISSIGDGTLSGAILKLYELINAIPKITSGTAEPSGGSDGDVYIMHE